MIITDLLITHYVPDCAKGVCMQYSFLTITHNLYITKHNTYTENDVKRVYTV